MTHSKYRIRWAAHRLRRVHEEEAKRYPATPADIWRRSTLYPRICAALAIGSYPLSTGKTVLRAILYASLHDPTPPLFGGIWNDVCAKALRIG